MLQESCKCAGKTMPFIKSILCLAAAVTVSFSFLFASCQNPPPAARTPDAKTPEAVIAPTALPAPSPAANNSEPIIYKNENFGFSLVFPADWKDRYVVQETKGGITIYSKRLYESTIYKGMGHLFSIERHIGELISREDLSLASPVPVTYLLSGNGYTYYARSPSDVQYPMQEDKDLSDDYIDMNRKKAEILQSFKLLGAKAPVPANEGYKVVGCIFFAVEIPGQWDLKASKEKKLAWDIFSEDSIAGRISLIPYRSETIPSDGSALREYILNDYNSSSSNRNAEIVLYKKTADQDTMRKIKGSFRFTGGGITSVDMLSIANRYLELGGIKIFGKIDSIKTENGKLRGVNIRVMKYVADASEKGFHIEDSNQIISYPAEYPSFMPLVGPDYTSFGTYDVEGGIDLRHLEKENPEYKNFYYDFIIGDQMVKMIIGHYVP